MSKDIECPYCGEWQEICHDDGYGYKEDVKYEQQCSDCEKHFSYTTIISFYYDAQKADCLNGAPHNLAPVKHFPLIFPDWVRCKDCGFEDRGKYKDKTDEAHNG